jgi:hypothetical protein
LIGTSNRDLRCQGDSAAVAATTRIRCHMAVSAGQRRRFERRARHAPVEPVLRSGSRWSHGRGAHDRAVGAGLAMLRVRPGPSIDGNWLPGATVTFLHVRPGSCMTRTDNRIGSLRAIPHWNSHTDNSHVRIRLTSPSLAPSLPRSLPRSLAPFLARSVARSLHRYPTTLAPSPLSASSHTIRPPAPLLHQRASNSPAEARLEASRFPGSSSDPAGAISRSSQLDLAPLAPQAVVRA